MIEFLGRIQKALAIPLISIAGVINNWIIDPNDFNISEFRIALAGCFMGIVVYLVPNNPEPEQRGSYGSSEVAGTSTLPREEY